MTILALLYLLKISKMKPTKPQPEGATVTSGLEIPDQVNLPGYLLPRSSN